MACARPEAGAVHRRRNAGRHAPRAPCRDSCRRWTGTGGSTVVVAGAKSLKVTKGQDVLKKYHEENFADRYFCANCGSGIYADGGETYYIAAGILKDVKLTPAFHCQVAYKEPWDEIGGSAPQFAEWPPS